MSSRTLYIINCCLFAAVAIFILLALGYFWANPSTISVSEEPPKKRLLPKNPFTKGENEYLAIQEALHLQFGTPPMQLPNLRPLLVFYGPSDRPDIPKDSTLLYFSLGNGKNMGSTAPGEKLYLMYDAKGAPPEYIFSPKNQPTPIWLEADLKGKEAIVKVNMFDENGKLVQTPPVNKEFSLQEREFTRTAGSPPWELGKWKVDGTLLARQRARWFGEDLFLEKHGGQEFENIAKKERIDFGEGQEGYSIYVGLNDLLVWKGDHWEIARAGKETEGLPLMQVKKVDERLLTFELWDKDGKHKITLNLLKSKEPWSPQQVEKDFKFVATRTRSQYVFEIGNERVILKPNDWLLLTDKGWELLDTEQEIDAYVDRKIVGPMFVFNGMVKADDKQVLLGTLFNATRTEMQKIELMPPQSNTHIINVPKGQANNDSEREDVFGSDFFQKFHESIEEE